MSTKILRLSAVGLAVMTVLGGASCSLFGGGAAARPAANDGGIFRSQDSGVTWVQKVDLLATGGKVVKFNNADIRKIIQDPQDHKALFATTFADGLIYSFDSGESWQKDKTFGTGSIPGFAIDYFNKCKWYIAQDKKVARTTNCGRDWKDALRETRADFSYRTVVTDHFNQNTVYAANNKELLKSNDNGDTWQTTQVFKGEIRDLVIDVKDSRILYVGLTADGIQKSVDGGVTWVRLTDNFKEFKEAAKVRKIVQDLTADNTYVVSSDYGLTRTTDGGTTWKGLKLLTPAGAVDVLSFAIDPKDGKIIYYGTDTTLYKTVDGGATWKTSKLPTSRRSNYLLTDYADGKNLFLGVRYVAPKQ